jgi:hypothetical protein
VPTRSLNDAYEELLPEVAQCCVGVAEKWRHMADDLEKITRARPASVGLQGTAPLTTLPASQRTKYAADALDQERNLRERIHEQNTNGIDDKKVFNRPRGRNDPQRRAGALPGTQPNRATMSRHGDGGRGRAGQQFGG